MVNDQPGSGSADEPRGHLTTRRGFITTVGFGTVSLYALWAAYGAAPTSLVFISEGEGMVGMGHGGGGMTPDEFRDLADAFVEANRLPDGSVRPRRGWAMKAAEEHDDGRGSTRTTEVVRGGDGHGSEAEMKMSMGGGHDDKAAAEAGHGGDGHGAEAEMTMPMGGSHDDKAGAEAEHGDGEAHADEPIEVYFMASRYGYEPDVLRLDARTAYKFRIMAVDADHGASINHKFGSHIIRSRARTLTELTLTFNRPGKYLCYCTVYCGEGHDLMMSTIVVT